MNVMTTNDGQETLIGDSVVSIDHFWRCSYISHRLFTF